jgi:hypothetical protein
MKSQNSSVSKKAISALQAAKEFNVSEVLKDPGCGSARRMKVMLLFEVMVIFLAIFLAIFLGCSEG